MKLNISLRESRYVKNAANCLAVSNTICTFATKYSLNVDKMCTVTLSYNQNDKAAIEKLAALLSTGLFVQLDSQEDLDIDYSDQSLYEPDPSFPEIDKDMTPEELEQLIIEDLHSIYKVGYAV